MRVWPALAVALLVGLPLQAPAQSPAAAITAVMQKSAADWNRGDLDSFATCYKRSRDILFIGRSVSRGYAQMLETYRRNYGSSEKMGRLEFSQLQVQPLDSRFATATGHFHLTRTAAGGGNLDGYFLLVFEDTSQGWKIVRDDSTTVRKQ